MNEELWKNATDFSKFEWLRQRAETLQKKCDELQAELAQNVRRLTEQVESQRLDHQAERDDSW